MNPIFAMHPERAPQSAPAAPLPSAKKPAALNQTQGTQSTAAAEEQLNVHHSKDKHPKNTLKPATDEYLPEEKQEPSGRYWMKKDENGHPKVYFDNPEQTSGSPAKINSTPQPDKPVSDKTPKTNAPAPDKDPETDKAAPAKTPEPDKPNQKTKESEDETCHGSTDNVDREIKKLKEKKKQLEQQCNSESDEEKLKDLEKELAKVENELRQKDNDVYRRQHTVFS